MKKQITQGIALLMLASMTACGGQAKPAETTAPQTTAEAAQTAAAGETEENQLPKEEAFYSAAALLMFGSGGIGADVPRTDTEIGGIRYTGAKLSWENGTEETNIVGVYRVEASNGDESSVGTVAVPFSSDSSGVWTPVCEAAEPITEDETLTGDDWAALAGKSYQLETEDISASVSFTKIEVGDDGTGTVEGQADYTNRETGTSVSKTFTLDAALADELFFGSQYLLAEDGEGMMLGVFSSYAVLQLDAEDGSFSSFVIEAK